MTEQFLEKSALCAMYGVYPKQLSDALADIKSDIGWRNGRQLFTPRQVRLIIAHLGEPLNAHELKPKS